jgi:hypothetical protein
MAVGILPERHSEVIPLYKNSEKSCTSNYTPISVLTTFSKIFEKVMYQRFFKLKQHPCRGMIWIRKKSPQGKGLVSQIKSYLP